MRRGATPSNVGPFRLLVEQVEARTRAEKIVDVNNRRSLDRPRSCDIAPNILAPCRRPMTGAADKPPSIRGKSSTKITIGCRLSQSFPDHQRLNVRPGSAALGRNRSTSALGSKLEGVRQ
jgi:hypothetical protein